MVSFEDLFAGYGMSPGLGGGYGGYGESGYGGGIGGMRQGLVGLGLGLLSGPGQIGFANAMKGYEQGAAIDQRGRDRQAQLFQQAQERALQRELQRERMGQTERHWRSDYEQRRELADKPLIHYKEKGYDDDGNPIMGAYIFRPSKPDEVREVPIEQAQKLQAAGFPASGTGAVSYTEGAPQPFTDMPESVNVEDRRGATTPQYQQQPQPQGPAPNVAEQLRRMGVRGPAIRKAIESYGTHSGTIAAEAAGGKMTEQQAKDAGYARRMEEAEQNIREGDLEKEATSYKGRSLELAPEGAGKLIGGALQSEKYNEYSANKIAFIMGIARKESQAQIKPEEFEQYDRIYFPQPYDSAKTIEQKRKLRAAAIEETKASAGPAYKLREEKRNVDEAKPTPRKPNVPVPGAANAGGTSRDNPVGVKTPAEARALKPGTWFRNPNGDVFQR
jgi:hypothetical protein